MDIIGERVDWVCIHESLGSSFVSGRLTGTIMRDGGDEVIEGVGLRVVDIQCM